MRTLLVTVGTRGDVQPYVALGLALLAAGHRVTLCTCPKFESFVTRHGIDFAPLEQGLVDLLESDLGRAAFQNLRSVWGVLKTIPKVIGQVGPIHRRMVDDSWAAVQASKPDVVVFHPKMFCVPAFAAVREIPAVLAMFCPMHVPTAEFPLFGPSLGALYNRNTYRIVHALTAFGTRSYLRHWRKRYDPMRRSRHSTPGRVAKHRPLPVIHAYSEAIAPRPADWPEEVTVSGSWDLPVASAAADWQPSQALRHFLDAGPPPVYIGFGSMADTDPARLTALVLEAVEQAGVRAVLAQGWGGMTDVATSPHVHVLEAAPHAWLFPRMAAVVHHGGAGTTAAGLRAGCPSLICPFGLDQPFWGRCVQRLGAGLLLEAPRTLTALRLSRAIRQVTQTPSFRAAAERVAVQLNAENGVENAVRTIERIAQARSSSAHA